MRVSGWYQVLVWVVAALPLCLSNRVFAAEDKQTELELVQAVSEALQHNPEIAAARQQLEAAGFQVVEARSALLPQLLISETYSRTDSPLWAFGTKLNQEVITSEDFDPARLNDPDDIDNFNTALSFFWTLYDGGANWIGWSQAGTAKEAAGMALRDMEQQVIARTATAYAGLQLSVENREVVRSSLATARAHLEVIQNRLRSGLAVESDVLREQVRIADLEQQMLRAESRVKVAEAVLKAVMGRADEAAVSPSGSFGDQQAPREELEHWIFTALKERLDLRQLALQERIASQEVERAQAGHWPNVALRGSYELNSEDFSDSGESYNVGAVVSLNLYSGERISARAAAAKAQLARTQALRRSGELGARVETQKAFYEAQSAWQSIRVAETAVAQAAEGLRIVTNRYQNGLLTIVDLLDAEVARQQASTQHFKAMHDYTVARVALLRATGTIEAGFR